MEASSSRERNSRPFVYLSGRAILGIRAFRFRTSFEGKPAPPPSPLLPSRRGAAKFVIVQDNFGSRDIAASIRRENESRPIPLLKGRHDSL